MGENVVAAPLVLPNSPAMMRAVPNTSFVVPVVVVSSLSSSLLRSRGKETTGICALVIP